MMQHHPPRIVDDFDANTSPRQSPIPQTTSHLSPHRAVTHLGAKLGQARAGGDARATHGNASASAKLATARRACNRGGSRESHHTGGNRAVGSHSFDVWVSEKLTKLYLSPRVAVYNKPRDKDNAVVVTRVWLCRSPGRVMAKGKSTHAGLKKIRNPIF